jgi:hypothetical protein
VSDILTYIKRRVPLPPPKKKKKSRNTWKFSKRKPYVVLLNKELVAEVDNIAIQLGMSRSALVEKILYKLVEQFKTPEGQRLEETMESAST